LGQALAAKGAAHRVVQELRPPGRARCCHAGCTSRLDRCRFPIGCAFSALDLRRAPKLISCQRSGAHVSPKLGKRDRDGGLRGEWMRREKLKTLIQTIIFSWSSRITSPAQAAVKRASSSVNRYVAARWDPAGPPLAAAPALRSRRATAPSRCRCASSTMAGRAVPILTRLAQRSVVGLGAQPGGLRKRMS